MIKTLKSELKLRPTYDEMIGMIEAQGDPNRPPIEQVIDRRATLFRNNQFGSQFDNIDFLGLKKQEEDKVKEEIRQTQLRQTAMATGSSMGVLSYGGRTPIGAYNADGFETPDSDDYQMSLQQIDRIRAELDAQQRQQQQASQSSSSVARRYLDEAHSQSMPVGIDVDGDGEQSSPSGRSRDDMPPLEPILQEESEEELIPAEDTQPNPYQRGLLYWNNDIEKMKTNQKINYDDLLFQLYIRGQLTDKMETDVDNLPDDISKKLYLLRVIENLIGTEPANNEWQTMVNDELLRKRIKEWRGRGKTKGRRTETQIAQSSSSSSTPLRDIAVAGAKAGVETLAKAGATAIAKQILPV